MKPVAVPIAFFLLLLGSLLLGSCQSNSENASLVVRKPPHANTVLIVDLGLNNNQLMKAIGEKITSYYQLPVKYVQHPLPESAFLSARKRYDANAVLIELKKLHTPEYRFVAGLTSKDISMPKNGVPDFGIFGLGAMDGGSCISSICRLQKNADKQQLYNRIYKVVLHEIGHNFGVPHCTSPAPCFMKDAKAKIVTIDNEPLFMCTDCKKKKRTV